MTKLRTKRRLGRQNKVKSRLIGGGIALAIVLLIVVVVLALLNSDGEKGEDSQQASYSLIDTSQATVTVKTNFEIDKKDSEKKQFGEYETILGKGDESYGEITYSLSYPRTTDEKLNKAIGEKTEAMTGQFTQEAKYSKRKNNQGKLTADMQADYEAYAANGRYGGIVFETDRYLADTPEPESRIEAFPIDFVQSRILRPSEIFKENGLNRVSEICKDAIKEVTEGDVNEEGLDPTEGNYANIAFSKESMRVYFNKYQVASGKYGMIEVRIPYTMLQDCLNIDMQASEVGAALEQGNSIPEPTPTVLDTLAHTSDIPDIVYPTTGPEETDDKEPQKTVAPEPSELPTPSTEPGEPVTTEPSEPSPEPSDEGKEPERPLVALTFDDGPHGECTNQILDILERYDAKATFFVVGSRVEGRENVLKRMDKLGCQVGNHTWSHKDLTKISKDEATREIEKTNDVVEAAIGKRTKLVRPPYGAQARLKEIVKYPMILWSVDTEDWKTKNPQATFEEAIKITKSGNILLFHDIYPTTVEAVEKIVPALIDKGYKLVTVSEMFEAMDKDLEAGQTYRLA